MKCQIKKFVFSDSNKFLEAGEFLIKMNKSQALVIHPKIAKAE
jgi:hypothetical protein